MFIKLKSISALADTKGMPRTHRRVKAGSRLNLRGKHDAERRKNQLSVR